MSDNEMLKPCPFCGGDPTLAVIDQRDLVERRKAIPDMWRVVPLYTHPAPDAEIVAALEAGRRYAVGYYNAALMSYDSAKAFEHETELKKIDAALAKAKGGSRASALSTQERMPPSELGDCAGVGGHE